MPASFLRAPVLPLLLSAGVVGLVWSQRRKVGGAGAATGQVLGSPLFRPSFLASRAPDVEIDPRLSPGDFFAPAASVASQAVETPFRPAEPAPAPKPLPARLSRVSIQGMPFVFMFAELNTNRVRAASKIPNGAIVETGFAKALESLGSAFKPKGEYTHAIYQTTRGDRHVGWIQSVYLKPVQYDPYSGSEDR